MPNARSSVSTSDVGYERSLVMTPFSRGLSLDTANAARKNVSTQMSFLYVIVNTSIKHYSTHGTLKRYEPNTPELPLSLAPKRPQIVRGLITTIYL